MTFKTGEAIETCSSQGAEYQNPFTDRYCHGFIVVSARMMLEAATGEAGRVAWAIASVVELDPV